LNAEVELRIVELLLMQPASQAIHAVLQLFAPSAVSFEVGD
jgi:hypothetical protein